MPSWSQLGRPAQNAIVVLATSMLVATLLLNGACGTTPSTRHCWQPGTCREIPWDQECGPSESVESGPCDTTLRVGACVAPGGARTYLYAPLHGLLPPNCERIAGPGTHFEPE